MAAHEHEDQRVVPVRHRLRGRAGPRSGQLLPAAAGDIAAVLVRQAAGCNTDKPHERVVRLPFGGPRGGGGKQRLLHGVLGAGEIAGAAHQRTEDLRRQLTQQVLGAHSGLTLQGRER